MSNSSNQSATTNEKYQHTKLDNSNVASTNRIAQSTNHVIQSANRIAQPAYRIGQSWSSSLSDDVFFSRTHTSASYNQDSSADCFRDPRLPTNNTMNPGAYGAPYREDSSPLQRHPQNPGNYGPIDGYAFPVPRPDGPGRHLPHMVNQTSGGHPRNQGHFSTSVNSAPMNQNVGYQGYTMCGHGFSNSGCHVNQSGVSSGTHLNNGGVTSASRFSHGDHINHGVGAARSQFNYTGVNSGSHCNHPSADSDGHFTHGAGTPANHTFGVRVNQTYDTYGNHQVVHPINQPVDNHPTGNVNMHIQLNPCPPVGLDVHTTFLRGNFGTNVSRAPRAEERLSCPIMMLKYPDTNQPNQGVAETNQTQHGVFNQVQAGKASQSQRAPSPVSRVCQPHVGANIRCREKDVIKRHLQPGRIVEVCGPPMVGKVTTLRQAIEEARLERQHHPSNGAIMIHNFKCKRVRNLLEVLTIVAERLSSQELISSTLDTDWVISIMRSVLSKTPGFHHVLVFEKCERLVFNLEDYNFLEFLERVCSELSKDISVTVIFTSYVQFPVRPEAVDVVEIDMLTDFYDVVTLLQYYAPNVEVLNYAHVCQKTLCLPDAVRRLAEEFIAKEAYRVTPEQLEKKVNKDLEFLSKVFESRLEEVTEWIPNSVLISVFHFSHAIESSFTMAHLEHVSSETLEWNRLLKTLTEKYVIRTIPVVGRLMLHPLVVFYCMTRFRDRAVALQGQWYDESCNKYNNFLCRILMKTEANMRIHGRKGLVYGCLLQEWPHVKYLIEMALHVKQNTYDSFLKVAVSASSLIMKCFTKEAKDFYLGLYNSAREYGQPHECAILEAFLGHAIAQGSGTIKGLEWQRAERHLISAIEKLTQYGDNFFLTWALSRLAIVMHRQGRYKESLQYFKRAKAVYNSGQMRAITDNLTVSEMQLHEEKITQQTHETIPIIFMGKNELAQKRIDCILELINNTCENHPELQTVLNLKGLAYQRGNNDLETALKWYKLSYNERMYLKKICPENLLAVLNNIAMILLEQGHLQECMKFLQQALDIRRECGWKHYYTALTLTHVSEVNMRCGDMHDAFMTALEAEDILRQTVKDHDMRLRLNLILSHLRVAMRQLMEPDIADGEPRRGSSSAAETIALGQSARGFVETERRPNNGCGATAMPGIPHIDQLLPNASNFTQTNSVPSGELFGNEEEVPAPPQGATANVCGMNHGYCAPPEARPEARPPSNVGFNNFPGFPAHPNTSRSEIDPVNLEMSPYDYLKRFLEIASEMRGTVSDHGNHYLLGTHCHCMLLNWGNSREKFEKHRQGYLQYVEKNEWIKKLFFEGALPESMSNRLRDHRDLYFYILNTPVEHLDLRTFTRFLIKACHVCKFAQFFYTEDMWIREASHLMQERERTQSLMGRIDALELNDDEINEEPRMMCGNQLNGPFYQAHTDNSRPAAGGLPAFNELMSQTGSFPHVSYNTNTPTDSYGVHYSPHLNQNPTPQSSNSPDLYMHIGLRNEGTVISGEENRSQPLVESPRIIEEQRIKWDMLTNKSGHAKAKTMSATLLEDLNTPPSESSNNEAYSKNSIVSPELFAGGNAMNISCSKTENNLSDNDLNTVKTGSQSKILTALLFSNNSSEREPEEQSWSEYQRHPSVFSTEENESLETRYSSYIGHEGDSGLDDFYHKTSNNLTCSWQNQTEFAESSSFEKPTQQLMEKDSKNKDSETQVHEGQSQESQSLQSSLLHPENNELSSSNGTRTSLNSLIQNLNISGDIEKQKPEHSDKNVSALTYSQAEDPRQMLLEDDIQRQKRENEALSQQRIDQDLQELTEQAKRLQSQNSYSSSENSNQRTMDESRFGTSLQNNVLEVNPNYSTRPPVAHTELKATASDSRLDLQSSLQYNSLSQLKAEEYDTKSEDSGLPNDLALSQRSVSSQRTYSESGLGSSSVSRSAASSMYSTQDAPNRCAELCPCQNKPPLGNCRCPLESGYSSHPDSCKGARPKTSQHQRKPCQATEPQVASVAQSRRSRDFPPNTAFSEIPGPDIHRLGHIPSERGPTDTDVIQQQWQFGYGNNSSNSISFVSSSLNDNQKTETFYSAQSNPETGFGFPEYRTEIQSESKDSREPVETSWNDTLKPEDLE